MIDKKYSIFISSTYNDLKDIRINVQNAILNEGHFPIAMENFTASNNSQWDKIKLLINKCDYYILILGFCYGTNVQGDVISYTQKEYEYALEVGKPILSFLLDESFDIKRDTNLNKINKFRNIVKNNAKLIKYCKNKNNLSSEIITSLHKEISSYPQEGWIRSNELETLKKKYELLKNEYTQLIKPNDFSDCLCLNKKVFLTGYTDNYNSKWYGNIIFRNIFIILAKYIIDYYPEDFLFNLITRNIDFKNDVPEYKIILDDESKALIRSKFKKLNLISISSLPINDKTLILWKLTEKGKNYFYNYGEFIE